MKLAISLEVDQTRVFPGGKRFWFSAALTVTGRRFFASRLFIARRQRWMQTLAKINISALAKNAARRCEQ